MSQRDYVITYESDISQALGGINQLIAALTKLDALATAVAPKVLAIGRGAGRNMNSAGSAAASLAAHLQTLSSQAGTAGTAMATAGTHATAAGAAMRGGAGHARGLGSALGGIGATAVGLAAVRAANEAIAAALKDAREYAQKTAEENLKLRDSLRELAALKGGGASTEDAS